MKIILQMIKPYNHFNTLLHIILFSNFITEQIENFFYAIGTEPLPWNISTIKIYFVKKIDD